MAKNDDTLKSLKIQNTDTQLSERIDGVTSQVFPDSDIIKKTDVSNIEAENAKEVIDVNENLNNENVENAECLGRNNTKKLLRI